ncbi:hypothetical protein [Paenibacillus xerothermodurans]|uniref:SGNH/GDSL hydrolase family protein n=1 Tax=Paenibacillus xerothermodurans TaxID=1977292 RepID=A0A2W1N3I6_PAEXE|nr:hypothetical protein [Paenibacillus xerothermodurans]PZE19289.1 hypothetical protein CBW46_019405 [Paenibacillus xerothermodurans]
MISFFRKNSFVLLLLAVFVVADALIAIWDPLVTSRRFYKNDFTKTLYHHQWQDRGSAFYGNSAVTGAFIEQESRSGLVEMGLSLGKLTDLKAIMEQELYHFEGPLVIGIDVHTMIDSLETDNTYQWLKPWYQPYVYAYRDYFRDTGTEVACQLTQGLLKLDASRFEACAKFPETLKLSSTDPFAYQPRWIDKELYFGQKSDQELRKKWHDYDQRFGWMSQHDSKENLEALDWILRYAKEHQLPLRVVWMPWNTRYALPDYMPGLQEDVNRRLAAYNVPVLDLLQRYESKYFHDLVHLSRHEGAPVFTKEVDAWLLSLEKPSR